MNKTYNIYIIHSPSNSENYIDRILATEHKLMEEGHTIVNPLPDQHRHISNESLHAMYGHKMRDCDLAYCMDGWGRTRIGNTEFAEMMIHRKIIAFEQQV